MSLNELETLVNEIKELTEANTAAIKSINDLLNVFVTVNSLLSLKNSVSSNSSNITALQTKVSALESSIGVVNKISKLLDVNIVDLKKDDLLQYDGDRWTNIRPESAGIDIDLSTLTLSSLADVSVANKVDGQSLIWSNTLNAWTNKKVNTNAALDEASLWAVLGSAGDEQIDPSHIGKTAKLQLLKGLDVTGTVSVTGNITATAEIATYSV